MAVLTMLKTRDRISLRLSWVVPRTANKICLLSSLIVKFQVEVAITVRIAGVFAASPTLYPEEITVAP
ncbi:MAG: hypothetical protein ACK47L_00855, partial [Pseudanabaena sp.]